MKYEMGDAVLDALEDELERAVERIERGWEHQVGVNNGSDYETAVRRLNAVTLAGDAHSNAPIDDYERAVLLGFAAKYGRRIVEQVMQAWPA